MRERVPSPARTCLGNTLSTSGATSDAIDDGESLIPDEALAKLDQMAETAASSTKIIASWAVALAAFGFFGFAQTHLKLSQGRSELAAQRISVNQLTQSIDRDRCEVVRLRYWSGFHGVDVREIRRREDRPPPCDISQAAKVGRTERVSSIDIMRAESIEACAELAVTPEPAAANGAPKGRNRTNTPVPRLDGLRGQEASLIDDPEARQSVRRRVRCATASNRNDFG